MTIMQPQSMQTILKCSRYDMMVLAIIGKFMILTFLVLPEFFNIASLLGLKP